MSEFGIIPERWTLAAVQLVNKIALGAMAHAVIAPNLSRPKAPGIREAFDPGAGELVAEVVVDRDPGHVPITYV